MWCKSALQSCGLSDLSVDGNPDKWKYRWSFSQKLEEEKNFLEESMYILEWILPFSQGFRRSFSWMQLLLRHISNLDRKRVSAGVQAGPVPCISLHIYYSSWFKLYAGRKRDHHFSSEYRLSYCISSARHASTLKLSAVCVQSKKKKPLWSICCLEMPYNLTITEFYLIVAPPNELL